MGALETLAGASREDVAPGELNPQRVLRDRALYSTIAAPMRPDADPGRMAVDHAADAMAVSPAPLELLEPERRSERKGAPPPEPPDAHSKGAGMTDPLSLTKERAAMNLGDVGRASSPPDLMALEPAQTRRARDKDSSPDVENVGEVGEVGNLDDRGSVDQSPEQSSAHPDPMALEQSGRQNAGDGEDLSVESPRQDSDEELSVDDDESEKEDDEENRPLKIPGLFLV